MDGYTWQIESKHAVALAVHLAPKTYQILLFLGVKSSKQNRLTNEGLRQQNLLTPKAFKAKLSPKSVTLD